FRAQIVPIALTERPEGCRGIGRSLHVATSTTEVGNWLGWRMPPTRRVTCRSPGLTLRPYVLPKISWFSDRLKWLPRSRAAREGFRSPSLRSAGPVLWHRRALSQELPVE